MSKRKENVKIFKRKKIFSFIQKKSIFRHIEEKKLKHFEYNLMIEIFHDQIIINYLNVHIHTQKKK